MQEHGQRSIRYILIATGIDDGSMSQNEKKNTNGGSGNPVSIAIFIVTSEHYRVDNHQQHADKSKSSPAK